MPQLVRKKQKSRSKGHRRRRECKKIKLVPLSRRTWRKVRGRAKCRRT